MTSTKDRGIGPIRLGRYPVMVGPFTHLAAEAERLSKLSWSHFEVSRYSPTIGAEIIGVDLTSELPDELIDEIRQALYEYKVIFFRDQPLTAGQHCAFASRFGDLEYHPFIPSNTAEPKLVRFEKGEKFGGYENAWHHDVTWRECPSMGAVLHAVAVPAIGGDTLFSDMYAAYESLDDEDKELIENLYAVHDFTRTFGGFMAPEHLAEMQTLYPPQRHPVVCTHPGTGRRYLYVNRGFTDYIEGLDPDESFALLDRLCRQADYPEHQCRFRWTADAVAFWDNRAVQHYATSDYYPHVRVTERASIVGTRPAR
jgi:alpha-ketoglutarate-dependent taurine dioxygenase